MRKSSQGGGVSGGMQRTAGYGEQC